MYDTVLFPTDGSETATEAAVHAIDLADRHDADIHVLYVVDHERVSRMAPKLGTDHIKATLQEEGETATSEIADRAAAAGLETTTAIREGAPADVITEYTDTVAARSAISLVAVSPSSWSVSLMWSVPSLGAIWLTRSWSTT